MSGVSHLGASSVDPSIWMAGEDNRSSSLYPSAELPEISAGKGTKYALKKKPFEPFGDFTPQEREAADRKRWVSICKHLPRVSLNGISSLCHKILSQNSSIKEFLKTRDNFPIHILVGREIHRFEYCKGDPTSWRKVLLQYFSREASWPLEVVDQHLHDSIVPVVTEKFNAPLGFLGVETLNRRIVEHDKISKKLKAAQAFADKILAETLVGAPLNFSRLYQKLSDFQNRCPIEVTSQHGGEFKAALNQQNILPVFLHEHLKRTTGHAYAQGYCDQIEDTALANVITIIDPSRKKRLHYPIFAVFDGHGGSLCSKFLADELCKDFEDYLILSFERAQEVKSLEGIYNFLKLLFVGLGAKYRSEYSGSKDALNQGSTATVAFQHGCFWYVACCGDTRAIRSIHGKAKALTLDANPENKRDPNAFFAQDVEKRSGVIKHYWDIDLIPTPRVMISETQGLNMTRSVGHSEASGVNARSKIVNFSLRDIQNENDFLVIATDGLWDVVTSHEVAQIVFDLSNEGKTPKEMADSLVKIALIKGSTDNITALVVDLSTHKHEFRNETYGY